MKPIVKSYLTSFFEFEKDLSILSSKDLEKIEFHLTHQDEFDSKLRDEWGNWDIQHSLLNHSTPFLDVLIVDRIRKYNILQRSVWPHNHSFAACVTHDVDSVSEGTFNNRCLQVSRRLHKGSKGGLSKILWDALKIPAGILNINNRLAQIEFLTNYYLENRLKATFYIFVRPKLADLHYYDCDYELNESVVFANDKQPLYSVLEKLVSYGFEIGLHGSFNTYNNADLLVNQKEMLQKNLKHQVSALRQHYLHFEIKCTPQVIQEASFLTDSSVGFNKGTGFRSGTCFPYYLPYSKSTSSTVLELPLVLMDTSMIFHSGLNWQHIYKKTEQLISQVESVGGCFTVNFHPNYLNKTDWREYFIFVLSQLINRNAYFATASEIHELFTNLKLK